MPSQATARVTSDSPVTWAAHVTGASDVTLAVACDGTAGLDAFLRWLQREGATETRTDVVLNKIR